MNKMSAYDLMIQYAEKFKINIDEEKLDKFKKYKALIKEWNEKINLTAITDEDDIIKKHFIDSISVLESNVIKNGMEIIDIGTGAGFPGIPLKIILPDSKILLVDSLNKRVNFLNEVIRMLELHGIEAIHGRAEEVAKKPEYREKFNIVVSRAVANMTVLSEYCIPFAKIGGYFIAMKGPSSENEIEESKHAISILGGKIKNVVETRMLQSDMNHRLVIVEKVKSTMNKYPRNYGQIEKKPLR
jgi:16S rRNA (guanine527-N7)-methyltransferase